MDGGNFSLKSNKVQYLGLSQLIGAQPWGPSPWDRTDAAETGKDEYGNSSSGY